MKKIIITSLAFTLSGCLTTAQVTSYTEAVKATTNLVVQIGKDIVAFNCANADIIRVIAKDAGAASRVQSALDKNAKIAADTCPLLAGKPAVVVVGT